MHQVEETSPKDPSVKNGVSSKFLNSSKFSSLQIGRNHQKTSVFILHESEWRGLFGQEMSLCHYSPRRNRNRVGYNEYFAKFSKKKALQNIIVLDAVVFEKKKGRQESEGSKEL
jgi:hypothetical protein